MAALLASMGPRARARGNEQEKLEQARQRFASMGPRARARGNKSTAWLSAIAAWLQWGHERALVEMIALGVSPRPHAVLQWGHERALVEIRGRAGRRPISRCFNGATSARPGENGAAASTPPPNPN